MVSARSLTVLFALSTFSELAFAAPNGNKGGSHNGGNGNGGSPTTTTVKTTARTTTTSPSSAPTCHCTSFDANFDDLTGIPGDVLNPIPMPYDDLYYQAFDFVDVVQTNAAPGPLPHSPPNYATSNVVTETNAGTPMITVNYQNSNISYFNLKSFYYACVLNAGTGAAATNTQCNINIAGYRGPDNSINDATQVCAQEFQYNPTTATGVQQQAFGQVTSACSKVSFVTIAYTLPGGSAALQSDLAIVVDDVVYDACSC